MTDIDHLRDIYSRLGGPAAFVEQQSERRGTVRSDDEVDADVGRLVAEMRARFGFRTTLDDDALVAVVRGFYDGHTDPEIAADVGVSPDTVFRARMELHLLDDADDDVGDADADELSRLLREGASVATVAEEYGLSKAAVDRFRRVVEARAAARETNYHYPTEFEERLADVASDIDRHVWDDRRALVDAHED